MNPDLESIRISLTTLAASSSEVPPEQVPGLVAELARVQAALLVALNRTAAAVQREAQRPDSDRMLDVKDAAEMLGVTRKWLYKHASTLAFSRKLSRKTLRFSRAGIAKWLATKRL